MVSTGRNIKVERTRRDWTLDDLSERSGLAVSTLSLIENDNAQPRLDTLQRLAAAFEMPLSALITDAPMPTTGATDSQQGRVDPATQPTNAVNGENVKREQPRDMAQPR